MNRAQQILKTVFEDAHADSMEEFQDKLEELEYDFGPRDPGLKRQKLLKRVYLSFRKRFGDPISKGGYRAVFDTSRGYVIKVPVGLAGEWENRQEVEAYQNAKSGGNPKSSLKPNQMAKCRLLMVSGVPIVLMEKVEPYEPITKVKKPYGWDINMPVYDQDADDPGWINSLDNQQVGVRNGKLKAYDYNRDSDGDLITGKDDSDEEPAYVRK